MFMGRTQSTCVIMNVVTTSPSFQHFDLESSDVKLAMWLGDIEQSNIIRENNTPMVQ